MLGGAYPKPRLGGFIKAAYRDGGHTPMLALLAPRPNLAPARAAGCGAAERGRSAWGKGAAAAESKERAARSMPRPDGVVSGNRGARPGADTGRNAGATAAERNERAGFRGNQDLRLPASASRRALRKTSSSIFSVSLPVEVFCWLG